MAVACYSYCKQTVCKSVVDGLYSRFGIFIDGDSLKQNGIRLIDYKMWLFIYIAVFAFFIKCDIFY